MSQDYCVYKHTSPSGKVYIGQTNNYRRRTSEHKKRSNSGLAFSNAIKKYGWNNFTHEIIKNGLTIEEANYYEVFYIAKYNSIKPNGYNLTTGGCNAKLNDEVRLKISKSNMGKKPSLETRQKMSSAGKNRLPISEKTREKLSAIGKNRKRSPESIKKSAEKQRGKIISQETRDKISKANTGKKHSEESKKKRSERMFGAGNPNFGKPNTNPANAEQLRKLAKERIGKPLSQETRDKIGAKNKNKSPETIAKFKASATGKKRSEESKKRMSEAKKNIPLSTETKTKLSAATKAFWDKKKCQISSSELS